MKLHELRAVPGSTKERKRRGRGHATGQGTTGGRGMNGQKSRSGGGVRLGFEGGQMPLYRRLPKRGFTNIWGTEYTIVNVDDLNKFEAGTVVNQALLEEAGVVKQVKDGIKILGEGELKVALTVQADKFSKTAAEKIEAAGGKAEVIQLFKTIKNALKTPEVRKRLLYTFVMLIFNLADSFFKYDFN